MTASPSAKLEPKYQAHIERLFERFTQPQFLRYMIKEILTEHYRLQAHHSQLRTHHSQLRAQEARVQPDNIKAQLKRMRRAAKYQRQGLPEVKG